ncbi:MAG: oligosaccharide flippase family protein [Candidatus Methanoperedens sp.]|nr:oligosaccharide flippase family protein [Candidatus Methanoperedens sp.]
MINRTLQKLWVLTPEASWVFVGQVGTGIAGLLGIKLLTHVLDPSEFGKLALANTIVALIGLNFFGPFGQGFTRFWSISKDRGNLDVFYAVTNRLTIFVCLISFSTSIILVFIFSMIKDLDWTILIALSLVIGIITGLFSLRIGIFTVARQRKPAAIFDISNSFLRPLIATFLVILTIASVNVALVGYLVAAIFVLLIVERLYSKNVSDASSQHLESKTRVPLLQGLSKEILSYSWPFLVWGIFGWIHMSCDRWSLQTFHGAEVVGAFAVVSQLSIYPLSFSSGFLSALFMPIAFQKAGDLTKNGSVASANRILTGMTGVYVLGTMFLIGIFILYHQQLILLISNERFVTYSYLLPWLTTAWGLFYLGQVLTQFGLLANKPQLYIMPKITASLVAGGATFYLSFRMGAIGVVWGLAVASIVYAVWCIVIAFKFVDANKISIR